MKWIRKFCYQIFCLFGTFHYNCYELPVVVKEDSCWFTLTINKSDYMTYHDLKEKYQIMCDNKEYKEAIKMINSKLYHQIELITERYDWYHVDYKYISVWYDFIMKDYRISLIYNIVAVITISGLLIMATLFH